MVEFTQTENCMSVGFHRICAVVVLFSIPFLVGCPKGKGRVEAPKLDADKMTDGAMSLCDANGDDLIDASEIKSSPALKFAKNDIDTDGDGKLSRAELAERFKIYVDVPSGAQGITMKVRQGNRNGEGFMDAKVRLVPEPFMEEFIEVGEGEVIDPTTGYVQISSVPGVPGVRVGMYRIEITHDSRKVPAKFNTKTILGIEVPPIASAATQEELIFVIK